MLFKLIKHNLKPIFKNILPFIALLLASVTLFNFTAYEPEDIYAIQDGQKVLVDTIMPSGLQLFLHGLASLMIYCSLILLFAVTIGAICRRFKTNFYGDEAYLTHTLPVKRSTLWSAQILSIVTTFLGVILAIVLNFLLLSLTRNGLQLLESFGLVSGCTHCVGDYYYVAPLEFGYYLTYSLVVFMELAFLALCGITGIIIKNRLANKYAVLSGVAIYMLGSILLLGLFCLISNSDNAILDIFDMTTVRTPDPAINASHMTRALLYIDLVYCFYCTALYFADQKLLKRGINLD